MSYQRLHVIHGAQVIPDDFRGHLPADVLTELIANTDHVEMSIHSCRYETVSQRRSVYSTENTFVLL